MKHLRQRVPIGLKAAAWALFLTLGLVSGGTTGHSKVGMPLLGIVEVRLQTEDGFTGPRPPAWDVRQRQDGSDEWSVRGDLYDSDAIGWIVLRLDGPKGSFRSAALPLFPDKSTTLADYDDEDGYDIPWHFRLEDGRLHIAEEGRDAEGRILLPGDTWSNVERSDIEVVFHPLFEKERFLLFRIFIDFEPPGDDR